jgi:hypothetical protein
MPALIGLPSVYIMEVSRCPLQLPSNERPHPTAVETTLPRIGRLARAPALFVMSARFSAEREIESIGKDVLLRANTTEADWLDTGSPHGAL